ncbi:hypothetical protein BL254_23825 [Protofrankia sp. BMG5.30]|nr:hypothetical protein BL254_23825 [Protofrankia sp. BMG5.30]
MVVARAIVTELAGSTSHAAVVSQERDRLCVVGCEAGFLADLVGREVIVDGGAGSYTRVALRLSPRGPAVIPT